MLELTQNGLYCGVGDFYIDPNRPVTHAVITHAHSDHARRGSNNYYCVHSGISLLKHRIGKNISVCGFDFREKFKIGPVEISFHPAGHILGSSQIRIAFNNQVWVVSGDYKRDFDPTCEPFEVVPCDVFVTEATFGTPSYKWDKNADLGREIFEWWQNNAKRKVNSVLFAYSLGKTQRILSLLEPFTKKPIYCHEASVPFNESYASLGIKLAPTFALNALKSKRKLEGELFLVPQSFLDTPRAVVLGDHFETAFASGWMSKGSAFHGYDKGFVVSDHADWDDLIRTVKETGAKRVYVQHRGKGALVRHLNKMGILSLPDSALIPSNTDQMRLF